MGEKEELWKFDDYAIKTMLFKISRQELEKCMEEDKVPSKEILDTINTLVNFTKVF